MATQEPGNGGAVGPDAGLSPRPASRSGRRGYTQTPLGRFVDSLASRAIGIIVNVLILLMVGMLVWAVVVLGVVVIQTVQQKDAEHIKDLVIGVLTIFIIIEIFDLFREYLRSAHIKVTNLAEVSLAVVLRELWLLLLDGSTDAHLYLALAAVVAALAGFWWLAMDGRSPDDKTATPPDTPSDTVKSEPPEPTSVS
jgi:uncharacterized membrane protein (DUF373 family)